MALVKEHPELRRAGETLVSANTEAAIRAWLDRDLSKDRDVLDRIDYAVEEAKRKAKREARKTLTAERLKAKMAVDTERQRAEEAVAAERLKAEEALKQTLDLIKQGYPVEQVEKMILNKS